MAITFAAIVPHSPLLIPTVARDQAPLLKKTYGAMHDVCEGLKESRPDVLLMLSCHQETPLAGLVLNVRPHYTIDYKEFGDYTTTFHVKGSLALANALKHPFDTRRHELPLAVISTEHLDYGLTTPLFHILSTLPDLPVVALNDTMAHATHEYAYGQIFAPLLAEYPGRIAVVASANLSHRLSPDSPAGFSPRAKAFDKRALEAIHKDDPIRLSRVRIETIREVGACGLGPMCILMGMLQGMNYDIHELAYEAPFGIGLPTFVFKLKHQ